MLRSGSLLHATVYATWNSGCGPLQQLTENRRGQQKIRQRFVIPTLYLVVDGFLYQRVELYGK